MHTFAIRIIGSGFSAIPVLAGSHSYILAEKINWKEGVDRKFYEAKGFYNTLTVLLIVGLSLDFLHIRPIKALIFNVKFSQINSRYIYKFYRRCINLFSIQIADWFTQRSSSLFIPLSYILIRIIFIIY